MTQPILVRPGTPDDLPRVRAIFTACFTLAYVSHGEIQDGRATPAGHPLPQAADLLEREVVSSMEAFTEGGLLVAEVGGEVIGFLATTLHRGQVAFATCNDLCVLPDHRRSGVATELVNRALAALRSRNIRLVFAESALSNPGAHRLLVEALGFRPVSQVFLRCLD